MSFAVFVDGTSNLPSSMLNGISVLPCEYTIDGESGVYHGDLDKFDVHEYYDRLRAGTVVKTSLLNTHAISEHFEPVLKEGRDVIYVAMGSGISGTYNAAVIAANELMEKYPDRFVHIVDSMGCGFGGGLLATRAALLSQRGMDARKAAVVIDNEVPHMCQYFTVDDLNYLKRTGRVSGMTAHISTILNIKPILYGDTTGHIVSCGIVRGRKKAIEALVKKYEQKRLPDQDQPICISHGACEDDANALAERIRAITPDTQVLVFPHEPFSGAHVGPGMLALFFRGSER